MKATFFAAPIIMMPNMNMPFVIETRTSDFVVSTILLQVDTSRELQPVMYCSKARNPAKRNYKVYNKELLAVIRACEEWWPYLEGNSHKMKVLSDH